AVSASLRAQTLFLSLTTPYRVLVVLASLLLLTLAVLALVYSHALFSLLGPLAKSWRDLPFHSGALIIFLLICLTGFPPIIGYSSAVTLAGFVYGFPGGWPIAASATVIGSTAAFAASRGVLGGYVHGLVGTDRRFVALGQVLRRDGIKVLTAIRFCPLPYSLSNGFLATIPSVSVGSFAAGTLFATPKLFVHVFIGSRLAKIAEEGDKMTAGDKAINYAGMLVGGIVGTVVGLVIYRRTMARAAELEAEALAAAQGEDGLGEGDGIYNDTEESVLLRDGGEADAAALMDEDDISLWGEGDGYTDGWDEEQGGGGEADKGGKK
ncbi:TLG2-vesicle protein, partial [Coniochaeta hoffmannii]